MVLSARDIVEKNFLLLKRDMSAYDAAQLMKTSRHGFAVIIDDKGNPTGIVTEWDYLSKITSEGRDAAKVRLEDIMSADLVSVKPGDGLDSVAEIMTLRGVRRVLVMEKGRVIGVITARTMLAHLKEYVDRVSSQIARLQAPRL